MTRIGTASIGREATMNPIIVRTVGLVFFANNFYDHRFLFTLVYLLEFGNIKLLHWQECLRHPIDLLGRPFCQHLT
jgi:hypothetical protein